MIKLLGAALTGLVSLIAVSAAFLIYSPGKAEPGESFETASIYQLYELSKETPNTQVDFRPHTHVVVEGDREVAGLTLGGSLDKYQVEGRVSARVDLSQLTAEDVELHPDGAVIVELPLAEVTGMEIQTSLVSSVSEGWPLDTKRQAERAAVKKAKVQACEADILYLASKRASLAVERYFNRAGFDNIRVAINSDEFCDL